LLVQSTLHSQ